MVPALAQQTLGWIKDNYLNVIVALVSTGDQEDPDYVLEFPGWLIDDYGLPDWNSFRLPEPVLSTLC